MRRRVRVVWKGGLVLSRSCFRLGALLVCWKMMLKWGFTRFKSCFLVKVWGWAGSLLMDLGKI